MIQEPYAIKNTHGVEPSNVPSGFTAFHNLNDNHHFGSMILVKTCLKASMEKCSSNEITIVKVSSNSSSILLICAYCRPSSPSISSFIKSYLLAYEADLQRAIICLDANAKSPAWNSLALDKKGKELENLLSRFHLKVANAKLASLNFIPAGTAFVDITLVGRDLELNRWHFLQDHSLSDHPYIFFDLAKSLESPTRQLKPPRTDNMDIDRFNKILSEELIVFDTQQEVLTVNEIDSYSKTLTSIIISSANRSKKRVKRRISRSLVPWWTEELEILRKRTRKAYKKWSRSRRPEHRLLFSNAKGVFQYHIRKAKNESFKEFIEEMNRNANTAFKELKKSANSSQAAQPQMEIEVDGALTTDSEAVLARFAEHFFPIEGVSYDSHRKTEQSVERALIEAEADSTSAPTINQGEVLLAAKSLKKKSAPGLDGLSTDLLLLALSMIINNLLTLFNMCLTHGKFPNNWKQARVCIIRKPGKSDYSDVNSFRPISVLPAISKLFEKVLLNRLQQLASIGNWIHPNQHGFQPQRSTESALHSLVSEIENGFEKKMATACAMIDIKSAFDTAWAPAILSALIARKCPTFLVKIIKDFLTNRKGKFDLQKSEVHFPIPTGCPQGSLLSPFLWNVMIDDILHLSSNHNMPGRARAYADDITATEQHKDLAIAVSLLQSLINCIKSKLEELKLKVNAAKTVLIIFNRKRSTTDNLHLIVDGLQIHPVTHTKLLGLTLDYKLNWTAHLNDKERQVRKIFFSLRSYTGKTWGLSGSRLRAMYSALVEPSLLYCCSVWAPVIRTKQGRKKLRSIERQFNILISRSFQSADTGALSVLAGTIPADLRVAEITARRHLLSKLHHFSPSALQSIAPHIQAVKIKLASIEPPKNKHPSRIKHAIRRSLEQAWRREWSESLQGDTTRSFFPYPECFIQLKVHNLPRQVIQILTGHSLLNAHQYHLKNTTTPACKCSFPSESIQHFLIDCPLHAFTRTTLISLCTSELGHWPPPLPTFHKSKKVFNALCTFIIRSKRLSPPPK